MSVIALYGKQRLGLEQTKNITSLRPNFLTRVIQCSVDDIMAEVLPNKEIPSGPFDIATSEKVHEELFSNFINISIVTYFPISTT